MSRAVPLWVGKTDDAKVPARVRLRVFEAHGGRCWISGRKIMPGEKWELDHKVALINGGSHSEDNLAPALSAPHREKTAEDVAIKSKVARIRAKHLGVYPRSPVRIRSRGFQKRRAPAETQ
jgi:5-methylcytosine-specific restriction endonuclease McrA